MLETVIAIIGVVGTILALVLDRLVPLWRSGRIQRWATRWRGRVWCRRHQWRGFKRGWGIQGNIHYEVEYPEVGGVDTLRSATLTIPGREGDPTTGLTIEFRSDETIATFTCANHDNRWGVAQQHMARDEYRGAWVYGSYRNTFRMYRAKPQLEGGAPRFHLPLCDFDSRNLVSGLMHAVRGTELRIEVCDQSGSPDAKDQSGIPYSAPLAQFFPAEAMKTPAQPHIERLWGWSSEAHRRRDAEARAARVHVAEQAPSVSPSHLSARE